MIGPAGATSFSPALCAEELTEGQPVGRIIAGWPVLLVRAEGAVHAMLDRCSHAAAKLSVGRIRRGAVMCPLHGARFSLKDGRCIGGAYKPLMIFDTLEEDGWIKVAVPTEPPGFEHMPVET